MLKSSKEYDSRRRVQVFEQSQLEIPPKNRPGYNWVDSIGENQITEKGCHYLSKAEWGLQVFILGTNFNTQDRNEIGDRGFGHICRASWPEIWRIIISIPQIYSDSCGMRE